MDIVVFCPFETSIFYTPGLTPGSDAFQKVMAAFQGAAAQRPALKVLAGAADRGMDYASLADDHYDLALAEWRMEAGKIKNASVSVIFYPNAVGMALVRLEDWKVKPSEDLEDACQQEALRVLEAHWPDISSVVLDLRARIPEKLKAVGARHAKDDVEKPVIERMSRAIVFPRGHAFAPKEADLLRVWLKDTLEPEDAAAIIEGRRPYSLTWVNYVIVDHPDHSANSCIYTMATAQYFWSAQEWLNKDMKGILADPSLSKKINLTAKILQDTRTRMQMLEVEYHDFLARINRGRGKMLREIMRGWAFSDLVENGARLSVSASQRLEHIEGKRAERRALNTDLILAFIGFLAIVDVIFDLHKFGREVLTRPVLVYNEDEGSEVLSFVSEIGTDATIGLSLGLMMLLMVLFYFMKRS